MRPIFKLAVAASAATLLSGCYVVKQGVGQAHLLLDRKPLDKVMASPDVPAEEKQKLTLIQEAKAYAEEQIGLRRTHNYQSLVQLDRDAVSYVVSAAPKDKLEPYTWWFPIIGAVPYKGFFDRKDAVALQESLKQQGYDTILRGVPAFSTLGWLPDPVYSPILKYREATLADIVIHETTHATLFLAGKASFNEGFATFVGNTGAQAFLKQRFGENSPQYHDALAAVQDNALFTSFIQEVSGRLEVLYKSDKTREQKLAEREGIFAWAKQRFETEFLPKMQGHQFRHFPESAFNNAALISYRTYYSRLDRFQAAYEKQGKDLRKTVLFFKDVVAKAKDPEAYLDQWLKEAPQAPPSTSP